MTEPHGKDLGATAPQSLSVMVAGSRDWPYEDWHKVYDALDEALFRISGSGKGMVLLHGCAAGPDSWADEWAQDRRDEGASIETRMFPPDYDRHGKRATHVRNDAMLKIADELQAFWDGRSRGTKSVIDKAVKRGIPWTVHSPAGVFVEIRRKKLCKRHAAPLGEGERTE